MDKLRWKESSKHRCELKKTMRGLPNLAPNASRWVRFKRWLRVLSLLDEENRAGMQFFAGTSAMRIEFYRHVRGRDKWVIHPFSRLCYLVYLVFFISWGVQLWVLPVYYALSLDLEEVMSSVVVCIMASIQSVIIIAFFFIGYVKNRTKTIVIDHKMVCIHYIRTFFIPDLIAVMGPVMHIFSPLSPEQEGLENDFELAYRYFILLCYSLRLKSLKTTMRDILVVTRFPEAVSFIIEHLCTMTLMIHLMSSIVISIPWAIYDESYPEASWFRQANIDNVTVSGITTVYTYSLLMTTCYFFGVSHGGYHITMPNEEITLFFVSFLGRLYTLYVIADLLRIFGLVNVFDSKYEGVMSMLDGYIKSKDLPPYMSQKLFEYCRYKLKGRFVSEGKILETLPRHIRLEVLLYSANRFLMRIPVFQVLTTEQLGTLIASMQTRLYLPGDTIIEAEDIMTDVNFIKCGTVAMYHNNVEVCHLEDGDTFEDLALALPDYASAPYQFTYVAVGYVELYMLRKSKFEQLLQKHYDIRRYFEHKGQERLGKFANLKTQISRENGVLSQLRGGHILEKYRLRPKFTVD
nr:unnamed protein product [Callosobruchus chinensis]